MVKDINILLGTKLIYYMICKKKRTGGSVQHIHQWFYLVLEFPSVMDHDNRIVLND